MAIGKCLRCDAIGEVSEDHVVPEWLVKRLPNFNAGVDFPKNQVEMVCIKCNQTKGGKVDFSFPIVREIMKKIIASWTAEIRKHEDFTL